MRAVISGRVEQCCAVLVLVTGLAGPNLSHAHDDADERLDAAATGSGTLDGMPAGQNDPNQQMREWLAAVMAEPSAAKRAAAFKPLLASMSDPRETLVRRFMDAAAKAADDSTEALQADVDWTIASLDLSDSRIYDLWAETLLKHPAFLRFGEKLANLGLAAIDTEVDALRKRIRGNNLDTLGRTLVAQGRNEEGRKVLVEALASNPQAEMAAIALAKLEADAGNRERALSYVATAWWDPDTTDEEHAELRKVYAKLSGGSLDDIERWLDGEYRTKFPNPIKTTPYAPANTSGPPPRAALIEVFTSASCRPCQAADLATDAVIERYGDHAAVLMYHQNIPQPDALTNPASELRANAYAVQATPTVYVHGKEVEALGGPRADAPASFERLSGAVETIAKAAAQVKLTGTVALRGDVVSVELSLATEHAVPPAARLHVVLTERQLSYDGGNGIRFHPYVVRAVAQDAEGEQGFAMSANKSQSVKHTFDLRALATGLREHLDQFEERYQAEEDDEFKIVGKARLTTLDRQALSVVAFVQDAESLDVLQVLRLPISAVPATVSR